jgi:glycosyltransferase involved in cell wall biosynthesis
MPAPLRITHVITGLERGGAEATLAKLLPALRAQGIDGTVISLRGRGSLGHDIEADGFTVQTLGDAAVPLRPARLASALSAARGDLVQTWMYHANLFGALAARWVSPAPVVWNLRRSDPRQADLKATTRGVSALSARLSRQLPAHIVCCGHEALMRHAVAGYDPSRMSVIYNGFDVARFAPDAAARAAQRTAWGVSPATRLIGVAARTHPQKDHQTLAAAFAQLRQQAGNVKLALCGQGTEPDNGTLTAQLEHAGIAEHCLRLGELPDTAPFWAAVDLGCSPSADEGLPNALGEALATGLPCITTDAGDSAALVPDPSWVVPTQAPGALADALGTLLGLSEAERTTAGKQARAHIKAGFSIAQMARGYAQCYRRLLEPSGR